MLAIRWPALVGTWGAFTRRTMTYRNDHDAALACLRAVEHELAEARAEAAALEALRDRSTDEAPWLHVVENDTDRRPALSENMAILVVFLIIAAVGVVGALVRALF